MNAPDHTVAFDDLWTERLTKCTFCHADLGIATSKRLYWLWHWEAPWHTDQGQPGCLALVLCWPCHTADPAYHRVYAKLRQRYTGAPRGPVERV